MAKGPSVRSVSRAHCLRSSCTSRTAVPTLPNLPVLLTAAATSTCSQGANGASTMGASIPSREQNLFRILITLSPPSGVAQWAPLTPSGADGSFPHPAREGARGRDLWVPPPGPYARSLHGGPGRFGAVDSRHLPGGPDAPAAPTDGRGECDDSQQHRCAERDEAEDSF